MTPQFFLDGKVTLYQGDNRQSLKALADNSIDSIVCDPPYALVSIGRRFSADNAAPPRFDGATGVYKRAAAGFMGQKWDTGETAFAVELWAECLRVLKPGGHVLAFSGTRTYHRLACAIEDAGFEIRDLIADFIDAMPELRAFVESLSETQLSAFLRLADLLGFEGMLAWVYGSGFPHSHNLKGEYAGLGTALKPALEPICLARKPLDGTVLENVRRYGTGALNIDASRVASSGVSSTRDGEASRETRYTERGVTTFSLKPGPRGGDPSGRWPANVVHDGSDAVVGAFPDAPGQLRYTGPEFGAKKSVHVYGDYKTVKAASPRGDSGSAARFYYSAKADADDRLGSKHPTVKPVSLMRYLVTLVTPLGGTVLDPFAGTGTTGAAAYLEGLSAILMEREPDYCIDIGRRMDLMLLSQRERRVESHKARGLVDGAGPLFAEGSAS